MGRAYDYWLRTVSICTNQLGTRQFRDFLGVKVFYAKSYDATVEFEDVMDKCLSVLDHSYRERNLEHPALLRALLIIGYFDREYRTGLPVRARELSVHRDAIAEIAALAKRSDTSWLKGKVVLNPAFGISGPKGVLLGDGDVIVDDTLYEAKTSRDFRPLETLRQLLGYVAMNALRSEKHSVRHVGFYYPRFGHLERFEVTDLCTAQQFENICRYVGGKVGILPPPARVANPNLLYMDSSREARETPK